MNIFYKALLFALIASVGNAIFVFGQKKSGITSNPFIFIILSLLSCIVLLTITSLFLPRTNIREYLSDNYKTVLITGVGLFITYIGFYLLYSRFGASYYILYAVLSIVTTSIILGVIYFREGFNIYYALSILSSIFTILFFYLRKFIKEKSRRTKKIIPMKELFKKHFAKKVLLTYIYGAFASRFLGFIVSLWAVSLVGHFFEFPTFKNLWGLNSHKALVSKETFEILKWIAQVSIGFFVFEIFHKTLFFKAMEHAPKYYKKGLSYLKEKEITVKARNLKIATINRVKEKVSVGKNIMKELYNKESNASN